METRPWTGPHHLSRPASSLQNQQPRTRTGFATYALRLAYVLIRYALCTCAGNKVQRQTPKPAALTKVCSLTPHTSQPHAANSGLHTCSDRAAENTLSQMRTHPSSLACWLVTVIYPPRLLLRHLSMLAGLSRANYHPLVLNLTAGMRPRCVFSRRGPSCSCAAWTAGRRCCCVDPGPHPAVQPPTAPGTAPASMPHT